MQTESCEIIGRNVSMLTRNCQGRKDISAKGQERIIAVDRI
jgi:hypothetical protein